MPCIFGFICYLCVELKLIINTRSLSNQALKSAHPSLLSSRCWPCGVFIGAGQPLQHGEVRDTNLAWVKPVVLGTTDNLPALWPDHRTSDHRTHAPGLYSVTTKSWWILYCWLTGDPLWDNPRGLYSQVSERSWILLSDMNGHIPRTTPNLNQPPSFLYPIKPNNTTRFCNLFIKLNQLWENPTCEGRLICPGGHVSSLNKCNPIQSNSSVTGEFPTQDQWRVFFDLRLNKRLSKQSWGWWFEAPLWRHSNE